MLGEEIFHSTSIGAATVPTLRSLADLAPTTLACMHGPSFTGDGGDQLHALAAYYEQVLVPA